jgi:hypothetical protein
VGLTTCDREIYTMTTLATFFALNDPDRFVLLQADDASVDGFNRTHMARSRFELVHAPTERQGHMAALRALVREAHARGCDFYTRAPE